MQKSFLDPDFDHGTKYVPKPPKRFNLVLACDSYKSSHTIDGVYAPGITGMSSYIEARTAGRDIIVPSGYTATFQKYFQTPITLADIDEAEAFFAVHGEPFKRSAWEHILKKYDGFIPLTIRGVPEGTPVKSGNALLTITCLDDELDAEHIFWLCSYFETLILRAVWYPSTISSMDYEIKKDIKQYFINTGADLAGLPFMLHDFGGRGVTSHEQAEIGGAAHLVNFMGSDTVEGVLHANYYYDEPMAAFSVPATEHTVETSFGKEPEQELAYLRHVLKNLAKPGGIVSIVIDGYDVYRCAEALCTTLKDEIIASGCKVVFRPDSGDMEEVVPRLLKLQKDHFGFDLNGEGYIKIRHVGILQGDGVDHMAIRSLLGHMLVNGYAADNIVFGSGGALLQKVNRDTYKWAQKASAVRLADGTWVGVAKDPVTDPGKKSKEGLLTLGRHKTTGELKTLRIDVEGLDPEYEDAMVTLYHLGEFYNSTTLAEIRGRCAL